MAKRSRISLQNFFAGFSGRISWQDFLTGFFGFERTLINQLIPADWGALYQPGNMLQLASGAVLLGRARKYLMLCSVLALSIVRDRRHIGVQILGVMDRPVGVSQLFAALILQRLWPFSGLGLAAAIVLQGGMYGASLKFVCIR